MEDQEKSLSKITITKLMQVAKKLSRKPERDICLIWMMYRHGLRVSEAINLKWKNINFEENRIYIVRAKGSTSGYHPLSQEDRKYLMSLRRTLKYNSSFDYIFQSVNGESMKRHTVHHMIDRLCERGKLEHIHPHKLRHSCGNHMAMSNISTIHIKEWLGHKKIENTVIYTQQAGKQYDNLQKWW